MCGAFVLNPGRVFQGESTVTIQNTIASPIPVSASSAGVGHSAHGQELASQHPVQSAAKASEVLLAPGPVSIKTAVSHINQALKQNGTSMQFTIDPGTKETVVRVTDTNTGELIAQYPSKVTLAIAAAIDQELNHGALLNQVA